MSPWTYQQQLKEARLRKGLSQREAADLVGVRERAWGSWERGTHDPDTANLRSIVEALQIPPEMVGYEPPAGWELVPQQWIRAAFDKLAAGVQDVPELQTRMEVVSDQLARIEALLERVLSGSAQVVASDEELPARGIEVAQGEGDGAS